MKVEKNIIKIMNQEVEFTTEASQTLKFKSSSIVLTAIGATQVWVYLSGLTSPLVLSLSDYNELKKQL